MPSPSPAPHNQICTVKSCNSYVCHHRGCKFIQEKDVTKWPQAAFTAWEKMAEATPGLSWNPTLVKAKVLGLKLTEQNNQVMDPSLTKQ